MKVELKELPLEPFPKGKSQRTSSNDTRISHRKYYLVRIGGHWFAGKFSKQWYGWNFNNWGTSGIQLDMIEGPLFEIVEVR